MGYLIFNYKKCGEQSSNCEAMKECLRHNFGWVDNDYQFNLNRNLHGEMQDILPEFLDKNHPIYFDKEKINVFNGRKGILCINPTKCIECVEKYCCKACSCFMFKETKSEMINAEYMIENEPYDSLFMSKDRFGAVEVNAGNTIHSIKEVKEKLSLIHKPFIIEVYNYHSQCSHFDSIEIEFLIGKELYERQFFKYAPKSRIKEDAFSELKQLYEIVGYSFELPALLFIFPSQNGGLRKMKTLSGIYKNFEVKRKEILKLAVNEMLNEGGFYD